MTTLQRRDQSKGFTLVEMVVVMVVLVVVMGTTFQLMRAVSRGAKQSERTVEAQMAATTAMESIVNLLQTTSMRGLDPANNFLGYQGTTLQFRTPQRNAAGDFTIQAGQVVLAANPTQITAVGTSLVSQLLDGAGNPIANPAPRVLCQNLSPDEVAAGADLDGNGNLERGVFFQVVLNEDVNGNGLVDGGEDVNGNGRVDCRVAITVQTVVLDPLGPDHGRAQMITEVSLRNT